MNLYSANDMTALLEKHGFFFKKNLGQNFLMNENTAARIAEASLATTKNEKECVAIEIGPGAGSLTLQLSKRFDQVIAIEIDPHLIPVLNESLCQCQNVTIHSADALKFDFSSLLEKYPDAEFVLCSNLPYYVTSEMIMRILESALPLSSVTVLIQKEAAQRLISKPKTPDFGAITAVVSYYASAKKLFTVSPGNFIPRPKVDSAVLQLIPYQDRPVKPSDEAMLFRVIHASFQARRKTLSNTLAVAFPEFSKEKIISLLTDNGIDPARRGETLTLEEFCRISNTFSNQGASTK